MKVLCYLLSICLLFMAGLPCADSVEEIFHSGTCEQNEGPSNPEADLCSPFCPCTCQACQGINLLFPFDHSISPAGYVQDLLFSYSFTWYQTNLSPILQPPQIG